MSALAINQWKRLLPDDLLTMQRLLSEPHLGQDVRAGLHFGLAKVLDGQGDHAQAAEHLLRAHGLCLEHHHKHNREYRPADYERFVASVMATFTPEFFARVKGFGLDTELPIFIVGLPRSGTTLVEQILASHSQVFGGGELHYCAQTFQLLPQAMRRNDTPFQCLSDLDQETARLLAQQQVQRLQALDERAGRIVDKMPENYHYLGLIRVLFPRAPLIHCRRDLRDVALSCWMTNFTSINWTSHPDHLASRFEGYRRLMNHWRQVLPGPLLEVDYEEMVEDLEGVARRLIQWCGLKWESACLKFYETRRTVQSASMLQVRQPVYQSSVGRWKEYETWLGELFSRVHALEQSPRTEGEFRANGA